MTQRAVTPSKAGEQAKVDDGAQGEHQTLYQFRQAHEGDGDLTDVAGKGGQERPLPYLTQTGDVGIQQLLEQAATQPVDEMVTQGGQGQLGSERDHQQQQDKADKLTQDRQRIPD